MLAVLAALVWLPRLRDATRWSPAPCQVAALARDRVTWYVTGYMGLQSLNFYVTLTWLPSIFVDAGSSPTAAGLLLAAGNMVQLAVTWSVPMLANRAGTQVPHVTLMTCLVMAGYVGLLVSPGTGAWLWVLLLGLGQGGSLALALLFIAIRAPDSALSTSLSAIAQSFGYVVAAAGPVLLGLLRQTTGGWDIPIVVVLGLALLQLAVGALAGRPRRVRVRS